jgi:hypothetical protein
MFIWRLKSGLVLAGFSASVLQIIRGFGELRGDSETQEKPIKGHCIDNNNNGNQKRGFR